ncbi:hypothetical protein AB0E75_18260 [Streptomyces griseoviridis]|uniref:Lipoprotein n=3 Tax=Streptomyces TaxID=1883 RepID=A0ABT9LDX5_STRGD|nr:MULTISPECIES: hypothetical protein [Streptomyces]MDP9681918.1 hypothetical protein [Streptomyces griseoviridis]GGS17526.1 hypothetical protein GCM10010238_01910 [Streptomyces niveoruber]GGT03887.1 hypothetical protein GCM10010240_41640 [Streptomyces griseoviridis]GGU36051.1 hypothetical protein GCM10010259_28290 [Streptomyces daghestanicus]GHI34097.1 hypothetical protein Sdagh_58270 [Streptomyces daghestanicus]
MGWSGSGSRVVPSALCAALVLTGCQNTPGTTPSASATAVRPSGYGAVFLAVGECSSSGATRAAEVPCAGERAAARVVARHDDRAENGPPCPAATDFVLHISESRPSADEDGDGLVAGGYACMRNLRPPHPGDPGEGGGPRTVVGDCVYEAGPGEVRETACAGTGGRAPGYRVTDAVTDRARCPAGTGLYVRLGGERPVGCARPV